MKQLVVIGDALLDREIEGSVSRFAPDSPVPVVDIDTSSSRPGGAALAAVLARRDGADTVLVTALADDEPAAELRAMLESVGVEVVALELDGPTPTKARVRSGQHTFLRLDHPLRPGAVAAPDERVIAAVRAAGAVLVADYGRGMTGVAGIRRLLADAVPRLPLVWDPHPRGAEPVPGARLLTPNEREAAILAAASPPSTAARHGATLLQRFDASGVAVTRGDRGAVLVLPQGPAIAIASPGRHKGDPCGAGDAFAAAAATALFRGDVLTGAVELAVAAASDFVRSGGPALWAQPRTGHPGGPPSDRNAEAARRAAAVRARGGTVIATSGCFDLLHTGHVGMLRAARALGDHLVVLLNADDSVRRLKGEGRPLQPAGDRAELLASLRIVDDVLVFEEDTPVEALRRIRPHVFVKGGDYAYRDLPEVDAMGQWGGEVVIVPYVTGRSTTNLIHHATGGAGPG